MIRRATHAMLFVLLASPLLFAEEIDDMTALPPTEDFLSSDEYAAWRKGK